MNQKSVTRSIYRVFSVILLVSMILSTSLNSFTSASADALDTDTLIPKADMDSPTKEEMALLLTKDLTEYGQGLPEGYSIIVDHSDTQDPWMIIAYYLTYSGNVSGGEAIGLAQLENGKWHVISRANPIFIGWLSELPTSLLNEDAKLHFGTQQSQLSMDLRKRHLNRR